MDDKVDIGLTPEGQRLLREIEEREWFADAQDIARFCFAYAVRADVPPGTISTGAETRWSSGNFDKTGEIRAVIGALFPDWDTPVRLIEHFIHEGLRLVHREVYEGGRDVRQLIANSGGGS